MLEEQNRASEARACYDRALQANPDWPYSAYLTAIRFLHRYPTMSTWTREKKPCSMRSKQPR